MGLGHATQHALNLIAAIMVRLNNANSTDRRKAIHVSMRKDVVLDLVEALLSDAER